MGVLQDYPRWILWYPQPVICSLSQEEKMWFSFLGGAYPHALQIGHCTLLIKKSNYPLKKIQKHNSNIPSEAFIITYISWWIKKQPYIPRVQCVSYRFHYIDYLGPHQYIWTSEKITFWIAVRNMCVNLQDIHFLQNLTSEFLRTTVFRNLFFF